MLVRLHAMIASGQGDSPQAIQLREEMEEPEKHLSEAELVRLNALSGDLSMTHGREIPDPEVVRRTPPAELPTRLALAYKQDNWEEVLALLRADVSGFLRPEHVAHMRSVAYGALHEFAPALAFMDEAARRAPANADFRALSMQLLWGDERYDDAYARAKTCLADPASTPRLVLMAGAIISSRANQDHLPIDITTVATQAVSSMEHALPDETIPGVVFVGYVALGLLAARLGDQTKAEEAFLKAISTEFWPVRQLTARGLLLDELELIRAGRLQSGLNHFQADR